MNVHRYVAIATCIALAAIATPVFAQNPDPSGMTPEERRAHWHSLSDEERAAKRQEMKAQREARRAEWQNMSDEERAAKRQQMHAERKAGREARGNNDHKGQRGHRRGKRDRGAGADGGAE